jgi:hypothetical protein
MSSGRRRAAFLALVVGCLAVAAVAIAAGRDSQRPLRGEAGTAAAAFARIRADGSPAVLFRSSARDDGQVALAAAGAQAGARTPVPLRCERVAFAGDHGLCLARSGGVAPGYRAEVFGPDFKVRHTLAVDGIPSRARVSPDGRYGAVTLFVTGHAYAAAGSFSTETTLIDLASGRKIAELEDFTVTRDGRQVTAVDVNYWGVTFARDSDRFYATLATGGRTYLIQGSVSGRSAHTLHENVECPSLSPDGTRVAYKSRTGSRSRPWRLTVLDLRTMRETPLAERRSIDDQAEWLDNGHVLYGVDGQIWSASADGKGSPRRFAVQASSPAVIRRSDASAD